MKKNTVQSHKRKFDQDADGPNPSGLCMCGCGQPTQLASNNDHQKGWVKGKPKKFIAGHNLRLQTETRFIEVDAWERFWEKVDRRGPNDCWEWIAGRGTANYGMFWLNGRTMPASRAIWIMLYGEIPSSVHICHECDNPPCCNPLHLWDGTTQENTADCVKKGRHASQRPKPPKKKRALRGRPAGEKHFRTFLTEEQAREIRGRYKPKSRHNSLIAKEFGISNRLVWMIGTGRSWKELAP